MQNVSYIFIIKVMYVPSEGLYSKLTIKLKNLVFGYNAWVKINPDQVVESHTYSSIKCLFERPTAHFFTKVHNIMPRNCCFNKIVDTWP